VVALNKTTGRIEYQATRRPKGQCVILKAEEYRQRTQDEAAWLGQQTVDEKVKR
jgi:hypothetical protein